MYSVELILTPIFYSIFLGHFGVEIYQREGRKGEIIAFLELRLPAL